MPILTNQILKPRDMILAHVMAQQLSQHAYMRQQESNKGTPITRVTVALNLRSEGSSLLLSLAPTNLNQKFVLFITIFKSKLPNLRDSPDCQHRHQPDD